MIASLVHSQLGVQIQINLFMHQVYLNTSVQLFCLNI